MSNLTEQNIDYITQIINNSKIESSEMKEDLIDHFCCAIEEEMNKGLNFEKSYDKAYQNICPDGFDEIQRETVFLLTHKNIKAMKRLLYVSGYLTVMFTITTLCLKLTNAPYGAIAMFLSFILLVFLFLPTLFLNMYKRELSKTFANKIMYIVGFFGIIILLTSIMFKVNHWGRETMLFSISLAILNFAFFPLFFIKMYKKSVKELV